VEEQEVVYMQGRGIGKGKAEGCILFHVYPSNFERAGDAVAELLLLPRSYCCRACCFVSSAVASHKVQSKIQQYLMIYRII
jgi:hypothetical protein